MKWNRKYILITVLSVAAAVGIVTGVVFAQSNNGGGTEPKAQHEALLDKVCEIYEENTGVAIDPQALQDAFTEAHQELCHEALVNRLEKLVDEGIITEAEADQYLEWWESRPDIQLPGRAPFGPRLSGPCGPRPAGFGFPASLGGPRLGAAEGVLPYYCPPDAA